eukprot:TRINITY_DN75152_c0_g1_i1.p2 TRINITY_DN75152_c0_g1~~TRINITY_DN75152_c0_g1_i1.p2  ORF type:complete len:109 (-),score=5.61 TRINITY_DN75152_c0_g1_i1:9-335(-)
MIYIREAHASVEWPLGNIISVEQHKTLQDRIIAAKELTNELGFKITTVVDAMDNNFNKSFQAWPERYYIFSGYEFKSISDPANEFGFDRLSLRTQLALLHQFQHNKEW